MSDNHLNDLDNKDTIQKEYDHPLLKDKRLDKAKSLRLLILLFGMLAIQFILVMVAIFYEPKPLDVILNYNIDVSVDEDGIMENIYTIEWKVLNSEDEALSWVRIGLPNEPISIVNNSSSICYVESVKEQGNYYYARIDFNKYYYKNEVVVFSFTTRHKDMAFSRDGAIQYEFTPGWFDEMDIENYRFSWNSYGIKDSNSDKVEDGKFIWEGSLKRGKTKMLNVAYNDGALNNVSLVEYQRFEKKTQMSERKLEIIVVCIVVIIVIFVTQIILLDNALVYGRGRGFIHSSFYVRMNNNGKGGRSGGGGGCACGCACACACAGGGRAGCSTKDFTKFEDETLEKEKEEELEKSEN